MWLHRLTGLAPLRVSALGGQKPADARAGGQRPADAETKDQKVRSQNQEVLDQRDQI